VAEGEKGIFIMKWVEMGGKRLARLLSVIIGLGDYSATGGGERGRR
jgi:hypothetical protein